MDFCVSSLFPHLCSSSLPFHFFRVLCLKSPFPMLQGKLNSSLEESWIISSFWFLSSWGWSSCLCELRIGWDLSWIFVWLVGFPLMGKAVWSGTPACWWLSLFFFVCCFDEASCPGCYFWLGDARSCIQVVSFLWVCTVWYSLGVVLLQSRAWSQCSHSKGSGFDLWSGMKIPQVVCYGIKGG